MANAKSPTTVAPFELGENIVAKLEGDTLHLAIDLSVKGRPTKNSEKTGNMSIASTGGNLTLPVAGRTERIGINVYRRSGK